MNAQIIYRSHLRKGQFNLSEAIKAGMIPKEDLIDGVEYSGYCRNSTVATWNNADQVFHYDRTKFTMVFEDIIPYPSDENPYDHFVPTEALDI